MPQTHLPDEDVEVPVRHDGSLLRHYRPVMSPQPVHIPRSVLVTPVGAATAICVLRALCSGLGDDGRLISNDIQPPNRVAGAVFPDELAILDLARAFGG